MEDPQTNPQPSRKSYKGIAAAIVVIGVLIGGAISQAPSPQTNNSSITSPASQNTLEPASSNVTPTVDQTQLNQSATPASVSCPSGTYKNVDDQCIQSPTQAPSVPAGATGICNDGSYTFATHHQGACSHHGGVASWL